MLSHLRQCLLNANAGTLPARLLSSCLLLLTTLLPTAGWAQSASVAVPYERQSFIQGTPIPAKINVNVPVGTTVSQVEMFTNTGGTSATVLVGTSTTAPYVINFTTPAAGFIQMFAKVTFASGATAVSPNRIITGVAPSFCNTGPNVKSFYVRAGAANGSGGSSNTLGASAANPIGSFQNIIKGGVTIGGTASLRPLPGDIIYIMANESAGYSVADDQTNLISMIRTGRPGCPITIRNVPGERPKLKMTSSNPNAIFIPSGVSYVDIIGLEIEGLYTSDVSVQLAAATNQAGGCVNTTGTPPNSYNGNGITIDGKDGGTAHPHHIQVIDNVVHNCSGAGIGAIEADYITIDNNVVYNNSWYTVYSTSGINIFHPWNLPDGQSPTYRNFIRNNKSYGNRNYVPWNSGCRITDGNGVIIDDFKNSQASSSIRNQLYTGRTLVANNVVFNNGGSGIHAFKGLKTDIINNTAYLNSQTQGANTPIGEIYAQESDDVVMVNNIIRPITGERTFTTNTGNVGVSYSNNLYLVDATSQMPTTVNNTVVAPTTETSVFVAPTTDAATADFRLKAGSAALNIGSSTYLSVVPTDIQGLPRLQGPGVDAGAYELDGALLSISQQPASGSAVCVGANVDVSVGVVGTATAFQWYKDGAPLTGVTSATTASLSLSAVTVADQGSYSVVITGFNTLTSTAFNLTVNTPPSVALTLTSPTLTCSVPSVTLVASGGVSYTFAGGGTPSGNSLVVTQEGTYSVTVSDVNGCTATASTTVQSNTTAPAQPALSGAGGTPPGLSVNQSSTPLSLTVFVAPVANTTLTFSNASGVVNPAVANISTPGAQSFSVTATGLNGCVSQARAFTITVQSGPIGSEPDKQTVCAGTTAIVSVGANVPTQTYQWYRNSTALPNRLVNTAAVKGTTTASLTLVGVQTTANYYCVVTSANGTKTTFGPIQVRVVVNCGGRLAAEELTPMTIQLRANPIDGGQLRATIAGVRGTLTVDLTDMQGRSVRQQQWASPAEGSVKLEWNLDQQASGVYLLRARDEQQQQTIRVINP